MCIYSNGLNCECEYKLNSICDDPSNCEYLIEEEE